MDARQDFVYSAKLAEQAKRYNEMLDHMKYIAKLDVELTAGERNLLRIGCKNVVGAKRESWRMFSSMEEKERAKGKEFTARRIAEYRRKKFYAGVEKEKAASDSLKAYDIGIKAASKLAPTNLVRLSLALNFSVLLNDTMKFPKKAFFLAKNAYDEAIPILHNLNEESQKGSMLILEILLENVKLWSYDILDYGDYSYNNCRS
ncbi:protein 14-3-3 PROTEIN [Salix viminalis]|uniref:Protein 14-3-3 PROTEIN n=1 Tax=Salix viminalis TaxID=40686 RepID=A0A9Q0TN07_SALVM|nr:protein 14-3-3 PROTEIN [Salix viminalis]